MEEDIVIQVFRKYLESIGKRVHAKPKTAAGPDFVVEGFAYECKGTDVEEKRLFNQLLQYASQYLGVGLVLPYDALTLEFIWKLEALEQLMKQLWGKDLELYLVADVNDRVYAIRKIGNAALLDVKVHQTLNRLASKFSSIGSMEEKEKKALEFLQSLESELIKELRELIIEEATTHRSAWDGGIINSIIE
jgi:hypothetical protein